MLAEMRKPVVAEEVPDLLQWGRERMLAEINSDRGRIQVPLRASMGPRAHARGNIEHVAGSFLQALLQWGRERMLAEMEQFVAFAPVLDRASMGPRAHARGNVTLHLYNDDQIILLQWGRERMLAEIKTP